MSDNLELYLWAERFRPHTVADCILPARLKSYFQALVDRREIENMTLVGGPGLGKTTLARAMCEELGLDHIVINASENGSVETVRTTVRNFASTVSLQEGVKVIILDEADFLTANAQAALRASIEEFSKNCRFIFTGNYANKFTEAILSRAPAVELAYSKDEKKELIMEFLKRSSKVLKEAGIAFTPEDLIAVVQKHAPDFRRIWNLLQRFTATGELIINGQSGVSDEAITELIRLLKEKDFTNMRNWVTQNLDNDGAALRRALYDKASKSMPNNSIPQLVLIIAEYDYKEAHVMDKEINAVAMLTTIMVECEFS